MMKPIPRWSVLLIAAAVFCLSPPAFSQAPGREGPPHVVSPEVLPDRHVTFRIFAPRAEAVRLNGGDIPGNGPGAHWPAF